MSAAGPSLKTKAACILSDRRRVRIPLPGQLWSQVEPETECACAPSSLSLSAIRGLDVFGNPQHTCAWLTKRTGVTVDTLCGSAIQTAVFSHSISLSPSPHNAMKHVLIKVP